MKTSTVLVAAAAAAMTGLISGSAARASTLAVPVGQSSLTSQAQQRTATLAGTKAIGMDDSGDKHDCKGKNDCKGKGGCKSSDNGCAGKNSCKGKGGCNTNTPATTPGL
jgi:hypothetical protein